MIGARWERQDFHWGFMLHLKFIRRWVNCTRRVQLFDKGGESAYISNASRIHIYTYRQFTPLQRTGGFHMLKSEHAIM
jgi:hypothetical protein